MHLVYMVEPRDEPNYIELVATDKEVEEWLVNEIMKEYEENGTFSDEYYFMDEMLDIEYCIEVSKYLDYDQLERYMIYLEQTGNEINKKDLIVASFAMQG